MKKKIRLHALLMSGGLSIGLPAAGSQSLLRAEGPPAVCSSHQSCLLHQIKFERPPATGSRGLGREQRVGPPPSREQWRFAKRSTDRSMSCKQIWMRG
jgi:hypothetical protein